MKKARDSARARANRLNAQKSTGPRTPEGRARSAQNARVHGLRSAMTFDFRELKARARAYVGPDADPAVYALACEVAAADLKVLLARDLRHRRLAERLRNLQNMKAPAVSASDEIIDPDDPDHFGSFWRDAAECHDGLRAEIERRLAIRQMFVGAAVTCHRQAPFAALVSWEARLLLRYEMRAMARRRMLLRKLHAHVSLAKAAEDGLTPSSASRREAAIGAIEESAFVRTKPSIRKYLK